MHKKRLAKKIVTVGTGKLFYLEVLKKSKQLFLEFRFHAMPAQPILVANTSVLMFLTLYRKKAALSLDSRYVTMVENAYYLVSPPDSPLEARRERPPLHQYIRYHRYLPVSRYKEGIK